ncbi:Gti1/Pac2 family-domain-containing protein [Gamsiella multidivaricata]|uniref:Gti1/Pac2 family-domain-containing protein n=1 Tax=Gamsiella multidivaricata TaxID=101098 RepID=UPI00222012E8|nr:Gti1/Pac2 family-domain-containing protein [Gamsiella multidivaricata]KAG0363482.1 hypothetical protein BGZ54_008135 [Gamsiella multidivaricata]KAI7827597.1 Gti1/Pac2 family-domain-containing protein [Gamsiella multidivaricata]
MSVVETFHGYIETTQDTLLIFEACRRGLLPRICRRLQEKERRIVQSGTVFVFDERESGIKRWTDGLVWSPSRILGNFLVYRELDKRNSGKKDVSPIDRASRSSDSDAESVIDKSKERALVGSLTNSYRFKRNGLIKKTMSIIVNGVSQHMISYYSKEDVLAGKLRTPSSVPELAGLEISPEFMMKQNFRIPPTVERPYDHLPDSLHSPNSNHSPRTPNGAHAHAMSPNGANFPSTGFGHHARTKVESDLEGGSPLDVFSKPYNQQAHHSMHTQQGYHAMTHLAGSQQQQQQHHGSHSYASSQHTFSTNFGYVSNSNGASDVSSTTPPSTRYMSRNQPFASYSSQSPSQIPVSQQEQQQQSQQHQQLQAQTMPHQRPGISTAHYGAGSPVMVMPSPGANSSSPHDFGLQMGYHSPATNGNSSTLGGISPQLNHSPITSQPQQHYHHSSLPPTTQGWGDFGYASYSGTSAGPTSMSDHHGQHEQHSASP